MKMLVLWILTLVSATYAYNGHPFHPHHVPMKPDGQSSLITEYEWKYFDYLWDSPEQKEHFIRTGLYNYTKMIPIDVDRTMDGRTFVTIIRDTGVPASLHTISEVRGESGPLLKPYPNWSWYGNSQLCEGITSVYRVAIDKCNRMWVLDTGITGENRICPAQLLVFNLYNDRLLFRKRIPDHIAQNKTGAGMLITPIVETYGKFCENVTVYMADVSGGALVVYNGHRMYRLEADVYRPQEENANFNIASQSFYLADGVLGMALSPIQYPGENRYLAFRPLASRSIYAADTKVLKRSVDGSMIKYYRGENVLPSQAAAMAFSSDGTLFFSMTKEIAIGCWNMNQRLSPENIKIAVQDYERLQFASGMKVVVNSLFFPQVEEQLLLLTNRLQKIWTGTQNFNEINFRIMRASVKDLVRFCHY